MDTEAIKQENARRIIKRFTGDKYEWDHLWGVLYACHECKLPIDSTMIAQRIDVLTDAMRERISKEWRLI